MTQSIWTEKLKYLLSGPIQKKVANPCPNQSDPCVISLIFSSHTLHSSLTGLFPITQTGQTHSCLGGFALADPSAGNIFTPNICRVFSHLRVFAQMSTIVSLTLTILFKLAVYAPCPTIPIFFLYFIFWHIFPFHSTYCLIMCYLICIAYQ